ncbi:MAG: hypothetical protein JRH16_09935 [Deltaproteobacteria bacterium]|nr:hypothetical protein [Deltaproteobacteria bacterium]
MVSGDPAKCGGRGRHSQRRLVAGADAYLLIETDALEELRRTRRVLPGVRGPGTR